jgi:nicotinate-nucleotide pyrophosphorylase (carboxylating)
MHLEPPDLAVEEAVSRALREDVLPLGDLSASLVSPDVSARFALAARREGVVAGRLCAIEAFVSVEPRIGVEWLAPDGTAVVPGQQIALIEGPLAPILTAERTALNFLCHLSGVATMTRSFVEAVRPQNPSTRILDTRKTTPGLRSLEKAAVRAGGGTNHRGNLSEGVMVKDNHLAGTSITDAVVRARSMWPGRMVEVECDRVSQLEEALEAGASVVMLDNMNPDQVAECVRLVRAHKNASNVLVEVSGSVTIANAPLYAAAGADLISVGALTHSAPSLDIGLDLLGITDGSATEGDG